MSIEIVFTPGSSDNPYELERRRLLRAIAALTVPRAGNLDEVPDHIRKMAGAFDSWIGPIGHQVSDLSPIPLDCRVFDGPFLEIVEGNATYVAQCAAEAAAGERRVA
jgi:hypothetical protein